MIRRSRQPHGRCLSTSESWIAKTVLLETVWVLRSLYGFEENEIVGALIKLLGLAGVQAEDAPAVAPALALTAKGLEFAGALHLASRPDGVTFASFDKSFVRRASRAGVSGVRSADALK
jgi:predicted nucleic-acid-binding protein